MRVKISPKSLGSHSKNGPEVSGRSHLENPNDVNSLAFDGELESESKDREGLPLRMMNPDFLISNSDFLMKMLISGGKGPGMEGGGVYGLHGNVSSSPLSMLRFARIIAIPAS